jgi:uncharacterized protein YjiS (DUF1127 family)
MRRFLARWIRQFIEARQRRAAREILLRLDARMLKDIGLESAWPRTY